MATTQPAAQPQPVRVETDALNFSEYQRVSTANPKTNEVLSFNEWAQREQVQLLRRINGKLNFFTVLVILALIVAIIQAIGR